LEEKELTSRFSDSKNRRCPGKGRAEKKRRKEEGKRKKKSAMDIEANDSI